MKTSAVILAGGQGRRMGGVNKALLTWGQETFLERLLQECRAWTDDIVIVGSTNESAGILKESLPDVRIVSDLYPGEGPMAGLHAGLSAVSGDIAWVLACDQPLASREAAALLLDRLSREPEAMAALPVLSGRPQPLHAVYRKDVARLADTLLQQGERRLSSLLSRVPWIPVEPATFLRNGIQPIFADDVDTPEDYARLETKAKRGEDLP
ncbi:molybdenum cofactor guanylyltransferase [Cohnella caldifontis]|uniref:molybdenum cofactor guanylyltransferase n=1 Tax=Cohnella caldifontis TaxID=3027471 RepID=UPI0023ED0EC7|nr:molybdenum cofactor guanylyltransferase [Cohnella sp. YIM B05605]